MLFEGCKNNHESKLMNPNHCDNVTREQPELNVSHIIVTTLNKHGNIKLNRYKIVQKSKRRDV